MSTSHELNSPLTEQELEIAHSAKIDIGAGYPQFKLDIWMRDVLFSADYLEVAYGFPPAIAAELLVTVTQDLLEAACQLLQISSGHAGNGFVTFSGSVALDRALESELNGPCSVICSSPTIDIIPGMLSERPLVEPIYVPATAAFDIDVDAIRAALRPDTKCIVLTSPENPSGNVVTEDQLNDVAALAAERGVTLILDQCFALIDPYQVGIPLLPNLAPSGLRWIFIWDTGKTFGFNEEKLGFLFCSPDVTGNLRDRMNIVQFDVSRRLKLAFTRVFRAALRNDYSKTMSDRVLANIARVAKAVADLPLDLIRPDAGSLLLLDTTQSRLSGSEMADRLLHTQHLGVIRVGSFFQPDAQGKRQPNQDAYIRLAMARSPEVVEAAVERLRLACRGL